MRKGQLLDCKAEVKEAFEAMVGDKFIGCVNLVAFQVDECIEAYWLDYTVMSKSDDICREAFTGIDDAKAYKRYNTILKMLTRDMAKYASSLC